MLENAVELDWRLAPVEVLLRWPEGLSPLLLHSGRYDEKWAKRSILALPVATYQFWGENEGGGESVWRSETLPPPVAWTHKPFADLRSILAWGGDGLWVGYLSYDLGRWVERLPATARADRNWPVVELGYCPGWLAHDTLTGQWNAHGPWAQAPPVLGEVRPEGGSVHCGMLESVFSQREYERAVGRCLEYIGAGDVFQVNLSQRFSAAMEGAFPCSMRGLYARLAREAAAWYGAYLEWPEEAAGNWRTVASASPELFLQVESGGVVTTRPIKGTRPASAAVRELRESAKDRAELNMIVDLMRNDLGRVCAYGSVKVREDRVIESHPTVHHGVATVQGRLHESKDIVDLLRACFPGGSVTGAPKVRAMQIIEELEPVRRGPYCGAIGYLTQREACLSMTIRTMLLEGGAEGHGRLDFSVGGGIVADSQPAAEYQETLDKAQTILRALEASPREVV